MKIERIISELQARKGSGLWRKVSSVSGVHYDTVARIARGAIKNPGALTLEHLEQAFRVVKAPKG